MDNKILNYDSTINSLDLKDSPSLFNITDYTSKKYLDLYRLPELSSADYIQYYIVNNDEKPEAISFDLYENTDYWDLLMLINNRSPLFDLPYNFDVIASAAEDKIARYNETYSTGNLAALDLSHYTELIEQEKINSTAANEDIRKIKVIKPSKIYDFIKLLREKGY